ncbi:hypothetical protein pb186bvf_004135, partial [Paramecium bursaria]
PLSPKGLCIARFLQQQRDCALHSSFINKGIVNCTVPLRTRGLCYAQFSCARRLFRAQIPCIRELCNTQCKRIVHGTVTQCSSIVQCTVGLSKKFRILLSYMDFGNQLKFNDLSDVI